MPVDTTSGEPPHNIDAEQAVLGACMLKHQAVDQVRGALDAGDFYRPAHETIWRAILALRAEDAPIDPIALADHLQGKGDLSRVGGSSYLHTLVAVAPPSTDNADYSRRSCAATPNCGPCTPLASAPSTTR